MHNINLILLYLCTSAPLLQMIFLSYKYNEKYIDNSKINYGNNNYIDTCI